jgi:hypothetical protein
MEMKDGTTCRSEGVVPHVSDNAASVHSGYWLLQRLARAQECFLVTADMSGNVYRNERFRFPGFVRRRLAKIKADLDTIAPPTHVEELQPALQWHLDHFDMNTLRF